MRPLLEEPRLGVCRGDVCVSAALLPAEVHVRVAPATRRRVLLVAWPVALERRPRLQQCPVHREVVRGEQSPPPRLGHHLSEEGARHIVREQPLAVLRERGGIERLIADVEVEEPLEEQVVAQPLTELALTANRVQRNQQARLEQMFRRDRGAAALGVHLVEQRRESHQCRFDDRLDATDRVVIGVLVWPLGVWWLLRSRGVFWQIAAAAVAGFVWLAVIGAALPDTPSDPINQQDDTTAVAAPTPNLPQSATTPTKATISYEVVQTWTIPNGGFGKVIVVDPTYLNRNDMATLGDELRNDTRNDRNAFIFIFSDGQAARLRDKVVADTVTEDERATYRKGFVGTYRRNANNGLIELIICYDGFVQGTDCQTTKY